MININHLRADYLFSQLLIYISGIEAVCIAEYTHTPLLLPFFIAAIALTIIFLILRKMWNLKESLQQKSIFLELTPPAFTDKTAYTTQQLFSVLHNISSQKTFLDKILGRKIVLSFEIVSTKEQGIRYMIRTTADEAPILERILMSYLPQVRVKQGKEYLPENTKQKQHKVIEFKLNKHFAFPLAKQNVLNQHDPVAYITGMMTKLLPNELIAFQVIVSPTKTRQTQILSQKILRNEDVLGYLNKPQFPMVLLPVLFICKVILILMQKLTKEVLWAVTELAHGPSRQPMYAIYPNQLVQNNARPARVLTMFEQETVTAIHEKMNQSLFETAIRVLVVVSSKHDQQERVRGIKSAFAPFTVPKYQSLRALYNFPPLLMDKIRFFTFEKRLLSLFANTSSSLLSISEIADLYHFPFTETTKTENIVKAYSKELPAPLSLKNNRELAVVFGENKYGGTATPIGLTAEERETHMYIIGRTGSGKTTMMFSMAKNDIEKGAGMAFVDPHGDVSEELLDSIPEERIAE
ncbi:MAG TPA: DUF87 domain-containing protein, partial [Candidatus Saccharimonadales bacterium]|nr:DUF87 domain-containing protein [Candidatus Saccharimonadales bacterium]